MKKAFIAIFALSMVACASQPLTDQEKAVRIYKKSDPPKECKEVGKVQASKLASITPEGQEEDLKREAAKIGANAVSLDQATNMLLKATAFKCD